MILNAKLLTILFFLLASCSSIYRESESISAKMSRFKANNIRTNHIPQVKLIPYDFKKQNRKIASIGPTKKDPKLSRYSNKRIYFLTLLSQYKQFKSALGIAGTDVQICPNFHNSLLRNPMEYPKGEESNPWAKVFPPGTLKDNIKNNPEILAIYPELSLPISIGPVEPTVIDFIRNPTQAQKNASQIVYKSFKLHIQKIHNEIQELCEHGNSFNYFIFENLVTHIKQNKNLKNTPNALNLLFKTSLFTNMILNVSLAQHKLPNGKKLGLVYSPFEEEVISRLKASWSKNYFSELLIKREKIIK